MCCEIRPEFKACYWMLVGEQRRSRLSGNAGYTMLDAGYWMLDIRYRIMDAGYKKQEA